MRRNLFFIHILFLAACLSLHAQEQFQVVVMGCRGGPLESNLSGYLIAPTGSNNYVSLDAGSLLGGIIHAEQMNSFEVIPTSTSSSYRPDSQILRDRIKAYLISHAHLDHVAGLVINSVADTAKPIFGLPSTINNIRDHLFNWSIWPNYGTEGTKPYLNKYLYQRMTPGQKVPIPDTSMTVEAFPLSHPGEYISTAFLIESNDFYGLYVGDTEPDSLSPTKHLAAIWQRIAPLIKQKKLCVLFIECSFPDPYKDTQLFGHLDPKYLMEEMNNLASKVDANNSKTALAGLQVVVTHIKESLLKGTLARDAIEQELTAQNNLGIQFVFPSQGQVIKF